MYEAFMNLELPAQQQKCNLKEQLCSKGLPLGNSSSFNRGQ